MTSEHLEPFASVKDLEARWHTLTSEERERANVLLDDASDLIRVMQPAWHTLAESTLKRVSCQMVKRAMIADASNPTGLNQYSQTAGSFSESGTYANPNGDLYVTAVEKQSLGIDVQQAFHVLLSGV